MGLLVQAPRKAERSAGPKMSKWHDSKRSLGRHARVRGRMRLIFFPPGSITFIQYFPTRRSAPKPRCPLQISLQSAPAPKTATKIALRASAATPTDRRGPPRAQLRGPHMYELECGAWDASGTPFSRSLRTRARPFLGVLPPPLGGLYLKLAAIFERGAPSHTAARGAVLGRARRAGRLRVAEAAARGPATSAASGERVSARAAAGPRFLFSITGRPVFF